MEVKVSVSIPAADIEFMDRYAADHGIKSRSGVVQRALALLRSAQLEDDYAAAWKEWAESEDAALWESTVADGLQDEAW
jgi:Arc/MetJ-type ribon-helix-helix transcriptional regulator